MVLKDILKPKKVFFKVTESDSRKGITTYCDDIALAEFNPVYKNQLIAALTSALESLIGVHIQIVSAQQQPEENDNTKPTKRNP